MKAIPRLQLLVPGLCGPLPDIQYLDENQLVLNGFSELASARLKDIKSDTLYSLLAMLFGITEAEEFPSAALSLLVCTSQTDHTIQFTSKQEILNRLQAGHYFLHADPVHLHAEMDHAIMYGRQDLNLSEAEANAFCEQLNKHFLVDGIQIFSIDVSHWFVCIDKPQQLKTISLSEAIGCNVNFILPSGEDSVYWKRFLNESQMLLYNNQNNQQREQQGKLTVNSLWLYGGGCLPADTGGGIKTDRNNKTDTDIDLVCCDNSTNMLIPGLAEHFKIPLYNIAEMDAETLLDEFYKAIKNHKKPLLYIDTLLPWVTYTDTQNWQQQVAVFYQQWLQPLLGLVRQGKLKLELYPCNNKKYSFSRYYRCRFRRKTKIKNYVNTY